MILSSVRYPPTKLVSALGYVSGMLFVPGGMVNRDRIIGKNLVAHSWGVLFDSCCGPFSVLSCGTRKSGFIRRIVFSSSRRPLRRGYAMTVILYSLSFVRMVHSSEFVMCGVLHQNDSYHVYVIHVFHLGLSVGLTCRYPVVRMHAMSAGKCSRVLMLCVYVWCVVF